MSISGISSLSAAPPAADKAPSAPTEAHAAFASAMEDASNSAPTHIGGKPHEDAKGKPKDDHDDKQAVSDDAPAQPVAPAQPITGEKAKDAPPAKSGKAADQGRSADRVAENAPQVLGPEPEAAATEHVDQAQIAPVLAALAEAGVATKAVGPTVAATAQAPATPLPAATAPLPTTAAMMAARAVPASEAGASATPARKSREIAAAGKTASIESPATATPSQTVDAAKADAGATATPDATQQLADGGAGRQLDLARQGAWLDGVARDIATTGDTSGTLRFQVAPQHLGTVQVELTRGAEGAAVTLTASSESSRAMLADARPQLVADARAQGIHIASAQVDVGSDSRPSHGGAMPEQRHEPRGHGAFSGQAGSGREGRPQTRSQPIVANQGSDEPTEATTSGIDAPTADGMYA